jgi:hypothetical protein
MRRDHGIGKDAGCAKCAKTSLPFVLEWRYGKAAVYAPKRMKPGGKPVEAGDFRSMGET